MKICEVCRSEHDGSDSANRPGNPPTCSGNCFLEWINKVDHRGKSCWVSLEVFCRNPRCIDCEVFKVEAEVFKRGLNKADLIGNY